MILHRVATAPGRAPPPPAHHHHHQAPTTTTLSQAPEAREGVLADRGLSRVLVAFCASGSARTQVVGLFIFFVHVEPIVYMRTWWKKRSCHLLCFGQRTRQAGGAADCVSNVGHGNLILPTEAARMVGYTAVARSCRLPLHLCKNEVTL